MRKPTPWRGWLSYAASLGVAPAAFWRLSLCEWRALAGAPAADALARSEFHALLARYPDNHHDDKSNRS